MARARLVYVMGASGAGKDSVLQYARRALDGRVPVIFAHRYITRALGEDIENFIALSRREFALRRRRSLFALHWRAYGFDYGIGIEIRRWLAEGLTVVVDGSRAHFRAQRAALRGALPVLITASEQELRRRLVARGRDDARAIERRLSRARRFTPQHPALVTIDNSGPLEVAGETFARLLKHASKR
ncbi:MAG TPA: phosphonate metabolism protein/1,5-bisphosphokinase (PRPP-forming) PhnN [Alphaproteobacteria bacterium]|jgi:ribose 1,5-bisphosphokinase